MLAQTRPARVPSALVAVVLVATTVVGGLAAVPAPAAASVGDAFPLVTTTVPTAAIVQTVDLDGDTMVVMAGNVVTVHDHSAGGWTPGSTLTPAATHPAYPLSVAVDGDTVVVGFRGGAVVFVRSGGVWSEQAVLLVPDLPPSTPIGTDVDVDGDTAVVAGATGGVAFILQYPDGGAVAFHRTGTDWALEHDFGAGLPDLHYVGAGVELEGGAAYLGRITLDADDLTTGAQVSELVRAERIDGVWTPLTTVHSGVPVFRQGPQNRSFSIDGARLAVATRPADGEPALVHVYEDSGAGWSPVAALDDHDSIATTGAGDSFGRAVAVLGERILVGDPFETAGQGSVHLFEGSGSTWAFVGKVSGANDHGIEISASGERWAVTQTAASAVVYAPPGPTGSADVDVDLQVPAEATGGDTVEVQVVSGNQGPDPAVNLTAALDIPGGATVTAVTASGGGSCVHTTEPVDRAACTWLDPTAPATPAVDRTMTLTLAIAPEFAGVLSFAAASSTLSADGTADNDTDSAATVVLAADVATLDVGLDLLGDELEHGANVAWDVTIDNVGPHDLTGAAVVWLDLGTTTTVEQAGSGWSCDAALTCTFAGPLPAGASTVLSLVLHVGDAPGTPVTGTALLSETSVVQADAGEPLVEVGPTVVAWPGPTVRASVEPADRQNLQGFGSDVATDASGAGSTMVVGAQGVSAAGQLFTGATYVFTRLGDGPWAQQGKLVSPTPQTAQLFGTAVAVDGDTLVTGGVGVSTGVNQTRGRVEVWTRDGGAWAFQAALVASDGHVGDEFGASVAIDGDQVLVGAPGNDVDGPGAGAAYVFTRTGTSWSQSQRVAAPGPAIGRFFGSAVGLDGPHALVGERSDSTVDPDAGAVAAYARTGGTLTHFQTLVPASVDVGGFGSTLDVDGDLAAIGSPRTGFALLHWDGTAWVDDVNGYDLGNGSDVAVSGDTVYLVSGFEFEGAGVLRFRRVEDRWIPQPRIDNGLGAVAGGADWGASLAVVGDDLVVGAPQHTATNTGDGIVEAATVTTEADLAATIVAPTQVSAGRTFGVTARATHQGPATAQEVTLDVTVPAGAGFLAATPSTGGTCVPPGFATSGTVGCTWPGATHPGQVRSVVVLLTAGAPPSLTVGATASSGVVDPDPDDDAVDRSITVQATPLPVVLPGSGSVVESDGGGTVLEVPVTLSRPAAGTVTVTWTTLFAVGAPGGQASGGGVDYTSTGGVVTFDPGETSAVVQIPVIGDDDAEVDEYLVVSFGSPTGATMGGFWGLGFGGILDDD